MKVWIFNHYAGPPSICSGLRHYNFAKYMIEDGIDVTIFASSAQHNSQINLIKDKSTFIKGIYDGVPFVYLRTRNYSNNGMQRILNMFDYYWGLLKICKKKDKPDVIYASSVHPLALVAGIKLARRMKIPCVCEVRDLWPESIVTFTKKSKYNPLIIMLYTLEKWIYKNADCLIGTTQGLADYIKEKGWDKEIDLTKIHYINNGVDLAEYNKNKESWVLTDLDLEDINAFKVLYTGSIRKANNVKLLINSAKLLKHQGYNEIKFILYGDGDQREDLERYCSEYSLDNVIFKGRVEKKYIPYILSKANVCYLEGGLEDGLERFGISPNKLFDYFASGKPVISVINTKYNIVEDYNCGKVVAPTPESVAAAIRFFYNLPNGEIALYTQSSQQAAQDFDFRIMTNRLKEILFYNSYRTGRAVEENTIRET